MQIDNYTVIAIAASTSTLFGLGVLLFASLQRTFKGFRWLGSAYLAIGIGTSLIAMRGRIPDAASITLSNTLIAVALACLLEGLTRFVAAPSRYRWPSAGLILLTAGVLHHYSANVPDMQLRIVFLSLVIAFYTGLCGKVVLTRIEGRRHTSQIFTSAIAFMAVGVSLLRAVLTLTHHPGDNFLISNWVQTASNLTYLLFIIGCAFSLIWMSVQRVEAKLMDLALRDHLTGLFNRRGLEELAERQVRLARRSGCPLSIIIFDADDFKAINDTHGHNAGDEVLTGMARTVGESIRDHDILCRYGGEEFLILLPGTDNIQALELAQRLRKAIQDLRFPAAAPPLAITASFGIASLDETTEGWSDLVHSADLALYKAKQAGKNRVMT